MTEAGEDRNRRMPLINICFTEHETELRKYNYLMLYKSAQIMLISQENDTNYILVFFNELGNLVLPKHCEHVHVYAKSLCLCICCVLIG